MRPSWVMTSTCLSTYGVSALIEPETGKKSQLPRALLLLPHFPPRSPSLRRWRPARFRSFLSYALRFPACFRSGMTAHSPVLAQTVKKIACIGAGYVGGPSKLPPVPPRYLPTARCPALLSTSLQYDPPSRLRRRIVRWIFVVQCGSCRGHFFERSSRSSQSGVVLFQRRYATRWT